MKLTYKHTVYACFTGYIVQAIINNFAPLLFLTFQTSYNIPLAKITLLITLNFSVQLITDLLSPLFIDKIGYRVSVVLAHIFSALGLVLLPVLPSFFSDPSTGLFIAVIVYAVGGGLLEVLISPIVEASPTDNKEKAMSLLHSFYCWGHVGVVLISTLFFVLFGTVNWMYLSLFWALIPIANTFFFLKVPVNHLIADGERGLTLNELFKTKAFWLLIVLMVCAGASEQGVSQWASVFAERGLGVSKTAGDLAGPTLFALMMGLSRLYYGKYGDKIHLARFMKLSIVLCIASYLLISFSPFPVLGFIGCALCGLSVGILWPGTFSTASKLIKNGGTSMFAFLALAGDLGCGGGPTLVGLVSSASGGNLNTGVLAGIVFPVLLLILLIAAGKKKAA
ncbi:MAG TPA: MFS transporter [Treponemataceae bacterium]|nr:MFS transporter [Treponemataceae bacterium]HQL04126.1 MFS transporter [Treponemataceae bacterium]